MKEYLVTYEDGAGEIQARVQAESKMDALMQGMRAILALLNMEATGTWSVEESS